MAVIGGADQAPIVTGIVYDKETTTNYRHHSGPTPSIEYLERADALVPGAADRLIRLAEGSLAHRREMQRKASDRLTHENNEKWIFAHKGQRHSAAMGYCALAIATLIAIFADAPASSIVPPAIVVAVFGYYVYAMVTGANADKPDPPAKPDEHGGSGIAKSPESGA